MGDIRDWGDVPGSILTTGGTGAVTVAEGQAPSSLNNALRDVMADINDSLATDAEALAGTSGNITSAANLDYVLDRRVSDFRNKIINGKLSINQRGVSGTVTLAAGAYGHDRFKAGASGCTYTFSTTAGVTTLTISAGTLQQVIEGSAIETATYYLSWTGTATARINAGSYGASGAVSAALTGGTNATVEWGTGTLSLPQLERDFVTPFSPRHIQQEFALCQRYYYAAAPAGASYPHRASNYSTSSTGIGLGAPHPVVMRAAPTAVVVWEINDIAQVGNPTMSTGVYGWEINQGGIPAGNFVDVTSVTMDAEL